MPERQIMLYLHVHQPYRLGRYTAFDTGSRHDYFTAPEHDRQVNNQAIFKKVAEKSYWPMNRLLQQLLDRHPGFRLSLSITGTFLEQCRAWDPALLRSFQALAATGRVEILAETYHHSLSFFYSRFEFEKQVLQHRELINELFGQRPAVFRNTELAYNNELAHWADQAGYRGIIAEGWDDLLGWRSPNHVYQPPGAGRLKLLLKNYRLSDDIAFRFSNRAWSEWPLTPEKYIGWINDIDDNDRLINLAMDYETFGEHQWQDSGIFSFFENWIGQWLSNQDQGFVTASEALANHQVVGQIDSPHTVTWADSERDLSAWLGNRMQQEALRCLYDLEDSVLRSGDHQLMEDWRRLQTSDHVYYMCTKWFSDGDVHAYFSPYDSPYDAFLYFMNALRDLRYRILEYQKGAL